MNTNLSVNKKWGKFEIRATKSSSFFKFKLKKLTNSEIFRKFFSVFVL